MFANTNLDSVINSQHSSTQDYVTEKLNKPNVLAMATEYGKSATKQAYCIYSQPSTVDDG